MNTQACNLCRDDAPRLSREEAERELQQLSEWELQQEGELLKLHRVYRFKNFARALDFTNRIGSFAESVGHHPDLLTAWGRLEVTWYTHKIGGLQQGDFICAAETEKRYAGLTESEL